MGESKTLARRAFSLVYVSDAYLRYRAAFAGTRPINKPALTKRVSLAQRDHTTHRIAESLKIIETIEEVVPYRYVSSDSGFAAFLLQYTTRKVESFWCS